MRPAAAPRRIASGSETSARIDSYNFSAVALSFLASEASADARSDDATTGFNVAGAPANRSNERRRRGISPNPAEGDCGRTRQRRLLEQRCNHGNRLGASPLAQRGDNRDLRRTGRDAEGLHQRALGRGPGDALQGVRPGRPTCRRSASPAAPARLPHWR